MFLDRYEYYRGRTDNQFYFYSNGPKGRILKIVYFRTFGEINGYTYYNLGFGDYDPQIDDINDNAVSNNGDRDKVLTTVAMIALDFLNHTQNCRLYIAAATPARARLYQMKIALYYDDMSELFDIQGRTINGWERFRKSKIYSAFRIEKFKFEVWEEYQRKK